MNIQNLVISKLNSKSKLEYILTILVISIMNGKNHKPQVSLLWSCNSEARRKVITR